MIDVVLDLGNEFFDALEGSTSDSFLGNDVEPDFDLIEPGGIGRSVMHVPSFVGGQPALYLWMLVCRIVVDHDVHIELRRNVLFDML